LPCSWPLGRSCQMLHFKFERPDSRVRRCCVPKVESCAMALQCDWRVYRRTRGRVGVQEIVWKNKKRAFSTSTVGNAKGTAAICWKCPLSRVGESAEKIRAGRVTSVNEIEVDPERPCLGVSWSWPKECSLHLGSFIFVFIVKIMFWNPLCWFQSTWAIVLRGFFNILWSALVVRSTPVGMPTIGIVGTPCILGCKSVSRISFTIVVQRL